MRYKQAILTLIGASSVQVEIDTWRVDWADIPDPQRAKASILRILVDAHSGLLFDTEESPLELNKAPLRILSEIKGIGNVFLLGKPSFSSSEAIVSWLDAQSWFATDPSVRTKSFAWKTGEWSVSPVLFRTYAQYIGAVTAILPYYDGVEWLLYLG